MQNYHKHTCYSNIFIADSVATYDDYAKRAKELGHKVISSVEHGWQSDYWVAYEAAKKNDLKFVFGAEAYWVRNRYEKDRSNHHIIILAKNENGRQAINDILSEANLTGYYYRPRVDLELLLSLPADDVFITSACIAFGDNENICAVDDVIEKLHNYFGNNFMLEIQYHNTDKQKIWNKHLLELSDKHGIEMIVGLDSHYIYPEDTEQRDYILAAKNVHYDDEQGWYMDYPDDNTVMDRFLEQGIFTREQIQRAMDNTDVCLEFDDYDDVPVFTKDVKLPTLYPELTIEERNNLYKRLITKKFKEYMKNIPEEEYEKYYEGVKNEVQTYVDTGMVDYPLLDYEIIKDGVEHGGLITDSGRGCFTKDALVHTKTDMKSIADIQIGDYVIDINGEFREVTNTMKYHIKEDMVKIHHLYGDISSQPNICTKDHKILIHRNGENRWIEAQNIISGDYVCLPKLHLHNTKESIIDLNDYNVFGFDYDDNYIYEYMPYKNNEYDYSPVELSKKFNISRSSMLKFANGEIDDFKKSPNLLKQILDYLPFRSIDDYRQYIKSKRTNKIHRFINIDYEFGQFVGLMYGDGCNSHNRVEVMLALNTTNHKNSVNRNVFENIAQRLGLTVKEHLSNNTNLSQISIRSKIISHFVSEFMFTSYKGKDKLFNPNLFDYSEEFRNGILNGLFLSDGSNSQSRKAFDNTSTSLINAFKILSLTTDNGITSICIRESGKDNRGYNRKKSYKLRFAGNPYNTPRVAERCLVDNNYWYLPVKSIEIIPNMETDVFDITVRDSHSYLINNMIVHNSAVSFLTNTLCGFSKVDRFKSAIKLYPERFMSKSRILETKSLPDIDMNLGTVEIFEESQKRVLGDDHAYPMIAFGTLKKKSAFKLYAKAKGMDFELANTISEQIGKFDKALSFADEDDKDDIKIEDFVDEQYHSYLEESKPYWGIVVDKKKAPSAYLLYQGSIRKEIGLIKCKSESTKKEVITTVMDGKVAESYKFLKNDLLKVDVVLLIDKVFKRIGVEHFDVTKLNELIEKDDKVWDLYSKGYTLCLNQMEKESTARKAMKYKPHNISELTALIAAIRPAFRSMYSKFESREPFDYGIPIFDKIIQTKQFPYSFILYQEQIMNTLNYAGFPIDKCYGILKDIAKKHPEKVKPLKAKFIEGFTDKIIEDGGVSKQEAEDMSKKVWQIVNDFCGYGFNCVSGSTKMRKSGRNGGFEPTVEEMYKIMNDYQYAKETGHWDLHKKYLTYGYGYALSMFDDKIIRQNKIVDIKPAGIRQTYEIKTATGKSIVCTDNHKFPTPNGKKRLDELNVGDEVYCMGEYQHSKFDSSLTDGNYEKNYPQKGECGFREIPNGSSVIYHSTRNKNVSNKNSCENCGIAFSEELNFELHHKDFNRHNNDISNYEWLCNSCHKKRHYDKGRTKRYRKGIYTYLDEIVSITPVTTEMTYDVEMAAPAHTFVSENGLVVSNSSHAYCMALDSLYQAWQKANYPYEFYEVMLQHYSDKGNKDKVSALKQEMLRAFGIQEGDYKFGLDNRKFVADEKNHVIYPSLLSIKGLSQKCSDDLYKLSQKQSFDNFYELLKVLKKVKSLNSAKINTLVQIDYFKDFGTMGKIQRFIKCFDDLYERSQFPIDKVPSEYREYIEKHSEKTEKQYRKFDYDKALTDIWNNLDDTDVSQSQKIKYEFNALGYIKTILSNLSPEYAFVQGYECKFKNPKLTLFRLCNGDVEIVKVKRAQYDKMPISEGDIIRTIECSNEGKWHNEGKDENGKVIWIQDKNDKETILKRWTMVK